MASETSSDCLCFNLLDTFVFIMLFITQTVVFHHLPPCLIKVTFCTSYVNVPTYRLDDDDDDDDVNVIIKNQRYLDFISLKPVDMNLSFKNGISVDCFTNLTDKFILRRSLDMFHTSLRKCSENRYLNKID